MSVDFQLARDSVPTLRLIRGARVFAPRDLGRADVLVGGGRVLAIEGNLSFPGESRYVQTVEAAGLWLLPGLVDAHIHILGGGGDGGPHTRNRDLQLSDLTTAGVTTVVGMLGTDATTRSIPELLAKARALELEGVTAFCTTGGYPVPTPTFSGSVMTDIVYIDRIVGVGEIAIADFRSSHPATVELARLASEAHMGGRLSGKGGVTILHLGDGKRGLGQVRELAAETDLPLSTLLPTHVNRSQRLFNEVVDFARGGGLADITATIAPSAGFAPAIDPLDAAVGLIEAAVPISQLSISSDAGGNMPLADDSGTQQLSRHPTGAMYDLVRRAAASGHNVSSILTMMTRNPAERFGLRSKGRIRPGCDADLLLVDEALGLKQVYARGRLMVNDGRPVVRATFETD